jgi:hypothetical protein
VGVGVVVGVDGAEGVTVSGTVTVGEVVSSFDASSLVSDPASPCIIWYPMKPTTINNSTMTKLGMTCLISNFLTTDSRIPYDS